MKNEGSKKAMKLILSEDDGTVIDSWNSADEYDIEVFDAVRGAVSGPTRMMLGLMLAEILKEASGERKT